MARISVIVVDRRPASSPKKGHGDTTHARMSTASRFARGDRLRRLRPSSFAILAVVVFVLTAGGAEARTGVEPSVAPKGATQELTFTCVNDGSTAIVAFEVEMPDGVTTYVPAVPTGWVVSINDRTIRWTGGSIGVGASILLRLRLGPLPSTPTTRFRVAETHEDGAVARSAESGSDAAIRALTMTLTGIAPPTTTTIVANFGHDHVAADGTETGASTSTRTQGTNWPAGVIMLATAIAGASIALSWALFVRSRSRGVRRSPSA